MSKVWHPGSKVRATAIANGWRSGLEEKVGEQLDKLGVFYDFEGEKIAYTKPSRVSKYTPDFPLVTLGSGKKIYVETKGQFKVADRQKHLLIKEQHPEIDLRFVFSRSAQKISKQSNTSYGDWCLKHGFLYADRFVPQEWLDE